MTDPLDNNENLTNTPESGTERTVDGVHAGDTTSSAAVGSETENLRAERNALYERLARAQADFQNSTKRLEADLQTRLQYQLSKLIDSLLPVIDNFERALAVDPAKADPATILRGMTLVHDQWLSILKQFQVEPIAPTAGAAFDPHQHQAIMQQPSDLEEGAVVQTVQKGYTLAGKPLRPASVIVAKAK